MIVVDTSAVIAILLDEPERVAFRTTIMNAPAAIMSSATMIEARMVAYGRGGQVLLTKFDSVIEALAIEIVPLGLAEIDAAHTAFVAYGKGSGHPAQLNFGDLFSYALAKSRGIPLLFKGDDFAQTDIASIATLTG
jgi:ribonuclease VapC